MHKQSFVTDEEIEGLKLEAKATQVWLPIISNGLRSEAPEDSRDLVHLAKRSHADWLDTLASDLQALPSLLAEREEMQRRIVELETALRGIHDAWTEQIDDFDLPGFHDWQPVRRARILLGLEPADGGTKEG